jgi:hypothetical protein
MKIIAYDNFKPNVTLEDLKPYLPLEFLFDPTADVAEPFDRTKRNFEAGPK